MGRKIPMWQVALVMLFTILALMYSMDVLQKIANLIMGQDPATQNAFSCGYGALHIPLICSAVIAGLVAILNGYKWSFLEAGILASINRSMQAMLILLTVGLLIGSWIAAGVVPTMIYYGLMILKPSIFLLAGCVLCCIVALATGSSWTTAGTIGIALIGIGQGLGIEPAMTAGAIVSGAYFGDKMSPLSDTTNLAPAIAGSNLFDHIRHMVWTVTPSILIALIIYGIMGMGVSNDVDMGNVTAIQEGLSDTFVITPWLLLPPIVVILIVALKLPALPGLLGGILLGCILGSIFQGVTLGEWPGILHSGYVFEVSESFNALTTSLTADSKAALEVLELGGQTVRPSDILDLDSDVFMGLAQDLGWTADIQTQFNLSKLLTRGGMESMLWTINLIICAMCFGGIMDASGMLASLATSMLKFVRNTGSLVTITVFSCIFMNVIAADQYLSIILPGRMYKEAWEDKRLDPKNLSRALEDAGTITSALVPWNTCGATMQTFLGVQTWGGPGGGYGRYAFLNLINPLISIFYGFTGISMTKMSDEQYEKILAARAKEKAEALKSLEA
ncbi:MAG: Na+/H+ antiporter NhaC family protein [Anaerovoracaceae bacterium]